MNIDINIGPVSFYMEFLLMDTCKGKLKACSACKGSGFDPYERDCPACEGCGAIPIQEGEQA